MAAPLHPAFTDHAPSFVTAPGETDVLLLASGVIVVVLAVGLLFLRLHTLPERRAHKSQKLQFEIVAVLGLLALFTHVHLFWVAGLLFAFIDIPDFSGRLERMARSLEKIADRRSEVQIEPSIKPFADPLPSAEALDLTKSTKNVPATAGS